MSFKTVLAFAVGMACGCGSSIPIEDEPTCVDQVTDECVPEVVAEFCVECDEAGSYREGFDAASDLCDLTGSYREGFDDAADLCAANRPVCETCETCETCDPNAGYNDGFIDGLAAAGIVCDYSVPPGQRAKVCPDSRGE